MKNHVKCLKEIQFEKKQAGGLSKMLVIDVFRDSIIYEESLLAHCIHHLLEEKKISLDDDITKLDFNQVDQQKVAEMVENNVLGIINVGIYSLKRCKGQFVFIFAASEEEARHHYWETFHQLPLNCHEYPLGFQLTRGNGEVSFREMRRELVRFPAVVGYYERM
jgi:hypothetical protein